MPVLFRRRRRSARRRADADTAPSVATPPVTPPARPGMPRALMVLLGLALVFGVLLGMNQLKDYIAPIFLALNLVLAAAPLQIWLTRRKVPAVLAATVTGGAVFGFLLLFFLSLGWAGAQMVEELSSDRYQARYEELYDQGISVLARFGMDLDTVTGQIQDALSPSAIISTLGGVLGNVTSVMGLLGTTLIVIFFLMFDSTSAGRRLSLVGEQHPNLAEALTSFSSGVRRYWVVTTVFGLIVAVLDVIALVILGVPLAMAWGVLAFLTNYIPNIGFVIGVIPPALMALLANDPLNALLVVIVYSVLNFVVQSLIQPKFSGDAVGVTPTVTFLSLVVWAWVLGPIGALLALPATLLVKAILVDADPGARWVNAFVASNPDTARADSPAEAFHQAGAGSSAEPSGG